MPRLRPPPPKPNLAVAQAAYASKALEQEAAKVAATKPGKRNTELNNSALKLGHMVGAKWIGRAAVEGRLLDAARANGSIADDGENAARETIKSGLDKGVTEPHAPLADRPSSNDDAEVERLAKLSTIEYERQREACAERLGSRVKVLDAAVKERRNREIKHERDFLPHWTVEQWSDPVDGGVLLKGLQTHFNRFVVLPPHADITIALWVLHRVLFECFDLTPYLTITSPTMRCGKTRLMTMLQWLCRRGKKNDSMSKAAIYRRDNEDHERFRRQCLRWAQDNAEDIGSGKTRSA
jgi:hypothetical protein